MVESEGIEPSFSPCKGLVLPLDDDPMVGRDGVEPPEPLAADLQSALLPLTVYLPIIYPRRTVFFSLLTGLTEILTG